MKKYPMPQFKCPLFLTETPNTYTQFIVYLRIDLTTLPVQVIIFMPFEYTALIPRRSIVERCLKSVCTAASVLFYRDRRHADWLYEKMKRPETYVYQVMNVLYYLAGKSRVYKVISLVIEPVYGCNLSCSYCWYSITHYFEHKSKRLKFMPFETYKKALDEAPTSVESVAFALIGEPLLHPDIHTMIDYARSRGFRTVLYTNGTLLTGKIMDRIAKSGLDVLVVSVEPDDRNSLKHRGVKLQTIQKKIDDFLKIKPDSMEVKLSVVVHRDNADAVPEIENHYRGIIDHIKLSPMIRYNGTHSTSGCVEPWRGSLGVLTNGDVTPCCVSAGYWPIVVGNLNQHRFDDIVHGPIYRRFLKDLTNNRKPEVCHRCRSFQRKDIPLRVPALSVKTRKIH